MSEAIKIKEGGVDRSQNQINKLKTNTVGGGVCFWVPETERQTDDKRITENGTYTAEKEGLYGYDEITVSIPNTGSMSGKGEDGNDYSVTVDDDGYIVETKIPSEIRITTPPPRVSYNNGDTIDYSGIVVTLYDGNGNVFTDSRYPDGIVPFSELVFPVDKAHYEGDGEWTDGHGLNAQKITYMPVTAVSSDGRHEVIAYVGPVIGEKGGYPSTYGSFGSPANFLMTRYNGENYALWINGDTAVNMFTKRPFGDYESIWVLTGSSGAAVRSDRFVALSFEEFLTELPESTVNPVTVDPTALHAVQSIPVNWISPYNADTYTDTFDIVVHETSTESGTAHGNEGGFEGGGSEHGF